MDTIETVKKGDFTMEIHFDENTDEFSNPRKDNDFNVGVMACFHSNYSLGDEHDFAEGRDLLDYLKAQGDNVITLPLYLYDHSGITMNTTGFSCDWDSGQVGMIYATKERIKEVYGVKRVTKKLIKQVTKRMVEEVKYYDMYISGEVYGFIIRDKDGDDIESVWGYLGMDSVREEGVSALEHEAKRRKVV